MEKFQQYLEQDDAQEIILFSEEELSNRFRISREKAKEFLLDLSLQYSFSYSTPQPLLTGDSRIDQFMKLHTTQVVEIYGASTTGKSCFAMSLCARVQLPISEGGLDGEALYISTTRFSIKRLEQLIPTSQMSKIHVLHIRDLETQTHLLKYQIPGFIERHNIKLLVIDSIASNFRGLEEGCDDWVTRAQYIYETGSIVNQLASKYGLLVIMINEVSNFFKKDLYVGAFGQGKLVETNMSEWEVSSVVPALGNALAACVHSRIRFERVGSKRCMTMVFSPLVENGTLEYDIGPSGIYSL